MRSLILCFASICIAISQQICGLNFLGGTLKCTGSLEICDLHNKNLTALLMVPRKNQLDLGIGSNASGIGDAQS